jgi:hypothetical protein
MKFFGLLRKCKNFIISRRNNSGDNFVAAKQVEGEPDTYSRNGLIFRLQLLRSDSAGDEQKNLYAYHLYLCVETGIAPAGEREYLGYRLIKGDWQKAFLTACNQIDEIILTEAGISEKSINQELF